ncbi:MAG: ABC transporter ATP-binding protein [Salinigranum sp.]
MSEPLLEARGLRKVFGDVVANDDVDFSLRPGEIHSILGENGAGKSTFMKTIYGVYRPDGGELLVDGEPITLESPADALARGIGLVYQEFKLISTFSVVDNIVLGLPDLGWHESLDADRVDRVRDLSERYGFGLADRLEWRVSELSEGEKQRVELLKILFRDVDILLLDEPTSILTPQEVDRLFAVLERLVEEEDLGIVFISHKLEEALEVSDRITVFRDGRVVGQTTPAEADQTTLARMMVGDDDVTLVDRRSRETDDGAETLFAAEHVTVRNPRGQIGLDDVSFTVSRGEILGVVGVEGNGQSELVRAVSGLDQPESGRLSIRGEDLAGCGRKASQRRGIVLIPNSHGVVESFELPENCILDDYERFFPRGIRDEEAITERARSVIEEFNVKTPGLTATASQLSGGNKQKIVLGRKLADESRELLVAFNPTKGLDIDTKSFIHDRMMDERNAGRSVLLVTTDLEEALAVSDRIAVLNEGEIVELIDDPEAVTRQEIGLAMTRNVGGEA